MMLKVDPGLTYILSMCVESMYFVDYKGLSCRLSLRTHVLRSEGDAWYLLLYHMTWGHEAPSSFVGIEGTCVRNDFKSASASLSASLVSFERRSSSCRLIRAGILASCANYFLLVMRENLQKDQGAKL